MRTYSYRILRCALKVSITSLAICFPCSAAPAPEAFLDASLREFSASHESELWTLCRLISRPCGVEEGHFGDLAVSSSAAPLTLSKTTPRKVLDAIVERHPGYQWALRDGVINLEPKTRDGEDVLARKLAVAAIRGDSSFKAALDILHLADIPAGYQLQGRGRFGRISLELTNVTVREALNAIAKADGQVMWFLTVSQTGRTLYMPSWRKSGIPFSLDERKKIKWLDRKHRTE